MYLEKYADKHYRKHTAKHMRSDAFKFESGKYTVVTYGVCDDPQKALAVGLDGKRAEVSPLQYVPAEGLNTPSVKQSVEKQECNYNECGK